MRKSYDKHIYTLLVVVAMSLVKCFVGLLRNYNFGPAWGLETNEGWEPHDAGSLLCCLCHYTHSQAMHR